MGSHSVICYPTEVAAPPSAYWSRYPNLSLEWLLAADYSYTGSMDISSVLRSSQCYVMCRTLHLLVLKSICHFWDQVVSLDKSSWSESSSSSVLQRLWACRLILLFVRSVSSPVMKASAEAHVGTVGLLVKTLPESAVTTYFGRSFQKLTVRKPGTLFALDDILQTLLWTFKLWPHHRLVDWVRSM